MGTQSGQASGDSKDVIEVTTRPATSSSPRWAQWMFVSHMELSMQHKRICVAWMRHKLLVRSIVTGLLNLHRQRDRVSGVQLTLSDIGGHDRFHPPHPAVFQHDFDAVRVGWTARQDARDDPCGHCAAALVLFFTICTVRPGRISLRTGKLMVPHLTAQPLLFSAPQPLRPDRPGCARIAWPACDRPYRGQS